MVREILVVKRDILFKDGDFEGFANIATKDYLNLILENFEYVERNDKLENDRNYQQIIPYVWFIRESDKKVFLYKRSSDGGESRLHNRYSGGIGGHIDKDTEEKSIDPIFDAMMRELREEVIMNEYPIPEIVGFININNSGVEDVHFGVMAIAKTDEELIPADGVAEGHFYTISEIDEIMNSPNNQIDLWTKISWPFIKSYISN